MRSDELESAVRQTAYIGDAATFIEYTQAKVLSELNDKLATVFEDIIVKARAGYWLQSVTYTATSGQSRFRIPARSCVGGAEKVEMSAGASQPWVKLTEIPVSIEQDYRSTQAATPQVYCIEGDMVDVIPTPTAGTLVRVTYYIRPSRLFPEQSNPTATVRGRITAINAGTRVLTVNALPFDQSLLTPAAITSALQSVDVVRADGWHELVLVNATQTISGLNITVGGTDVLTDIAVGDFVRVADQTDWPPLPDDFHRCLADATAIKIMLELSMTAKAEQMALNNGADLQRFKSLLCPRVKAEPKTIPIVPRSRGRAWPGWRFS